MGTTIPSGSRADNINWTPKILFLLLVAGWSFLFFLIKKYDEPVDNAKKASIQFLEKEGWSNVKVYTSYGEIQAPGTSCLGKNYITDLSGEKQDKYLEARVCCSEEGECKYLIYSEKILNEKEK